MAKIKYDDLVDSAGIESGFKRFWKRLIGISEKGQQEVSKNAKAAAQDVADVLRLSADEARKAQDATKKHMKGLLAEVKKLEREFGAVGKAGDQLKKLATLTMKSEEAMRDFDRATELEKEALKELNKVQAATAREGVKLQQTLAGETRELTEMRIANQRANKELRESIKIDKAKEGSIDELKGQLDANKRAYRSLSREERENSIVGKQLNEVIEDQQREYDKLTGKVSKTRRAFTDIVKIGIGNVLADLARGAVRLVSQAFTFAASAVVNFDKKLDSLQALTGAQGQDLQFLSRTARQFGADFRQSGADILDAFTLAGSAQPELLGNVEALAAVTKEALTLSEATGDDLNNSIQVVTGTMNQFGLRGAEASRVINTIAAGSKFGAANGIALGQSFDKSGAVLKKFNVSVEEGVGLLEVLAEKNLKGAEAGTQLRNVVLKTGTLDILPKEQLDRLEAYGVNIDLVTDATKPMNERLREFSKIAKDAGLVAKIFGKENVVAASTILDNVDAFEEYTQAVTDTNVANEQAAINTDNLQGSIDRFKAVFERLVLTIEDGNGPIGRFVRRMIDLGSSFVEAVTPAEDLTRDLRDQQRELNKAAIEAINLKEGTEERTRAIENLNKIYPGFLGNLEAETVSNDELNKALQRTNQSLIAQAKIRVLNQDIAEKQEKIEARANLAADREFTVRSKVLALIEQQGRSVDEFDINTLEGLRAAAVELEKNATEAQKLGQGIDEFTKAIEDSDDALLSITGVGTEVTGVFRALAGEGGRFSASGLVGDIDLIIASTEKLSEEQQALMDQRDALFSDLDGTQEGDLFGLKAFFDSLAEGGGTAVDDAGSAVAGATKRNADKVRRLTETFDKQLRDLRTKMLEDDREREVTAIENRTADQLEALKKGADALRKEQGRLTEDQIAQIEQVSEAIQQAGAQEIEGINLKFDTQGVDQIAEANKAIAQQTITDAEELNARLLEIEIKRIQDLIAVRSAAGEDVSQLTAQLAEAQRQQSEQALQDDLDAIDKRAQKRRTALISGVDFENTTSSQRRDIEKQLQIELATIEAQAIEERIAKLKEAGQDTTDLEEQLANKRLEIARKEADLQKEIADQRRKDIERSLKAVSQSVNQILEADNKKLDEQISATQNRVSGLRDIAKDRALVEGESLAFEEKKLADLEARRAANARAQQRLQIAQALFGTYNSLIASGEGGNALPKAIQAIAGLVGAAAAFQSLPGFYEGTENVSDANATRFASGVIDPFIIRVHGNERVLSAEDNAQLGNISNDELVRTVRQAKIDKFMDQAHHNRMASATAQVVNHPMIVNNYQSVTTDPGLKTAIKEMHGDLKKGLKDLPGRMPTTMTNLMGVDGYIEEVVKTENKIHRKYKQKNTGLHGRRSAI